MKPDSKTLNVETGGERLDTWLAQITNESRSFVSNQIELGHISLNGKACQKPATRLKPGDTVTYYFEDTRKVLVEPISGKLDILHEDTSLLVLNKPAGLIVHPAPSHADQNTLVHYLLYHLQNNPEFKDLSQTRPGIVHRLDKGTSGILVVAKDRKTKEHLTQQFKDRTVQKTYLALCWGKVEKKGQDSGIFEAPLGRHINERKKMSSKTKQSKQAITHWKAVRHYPKFTLVELYPKTGRTHQLRVHLAEAGNPIVGDPLYGVKLANRSLNDLAARFKPAIQGLNHTLLHAQALKFIHPKTLKTLEFEVPIPEDFDKTLKFLESR